MNPDTFLGSFFCHQAVPDSISHTMKFRVFLLKKLSTLFHL
ncbi:hypothetical protein CP02DC18_0852 [Chlamydia psittaci 02DC18]|nr:uncharacterized protein CHPS25_0414 [Chlamydia psittaci]ATQ72460.1 uncharacterized protein CHPS23_0415 [Chlamydia psittaci]ATQ79703.1 uncharacterized protein CHPS1_0415 [Chlamydia psittaci]EPJ15482.1 hypothetical protein CP02DC18_0852 [Chlamydia psittaci 02DC18]EPJ26325.1 hypothetical protein CP09DC80_0849 [Chlamydia psittaci 09DC80]